MNSVNNLTIIGCADWPYTCSAQLPAENLRNILFVISEKPFCHLRNISVISEQDTKTVYFSYTFNNSVKIILLNSNNNNRCSEKVI